MQIKAAQLAWRASLAYCVVAGAWIFFSDLLLATWFPDPALIVILQTFKGWAFVLVTGALLFLALHHHLRRWELECAERRRAEAKSREPERRLATLVSNLPGLSYRCRNDHDFTTEFVSDGVAELTGYPASDFREHRRHFGQLIHPGDQEGVRTEIEAAIREKRPFELTYRIHTARGAERWVWERGSAIFDSGGAVEALEGFVTDVTERKQADEAVRQSKLKLAGIIDSVDGIFWEADARTFQFTFVSPQAERILGHSVARWLNEPAFWKDHIHPEDRDNTVEFCRGATGRLEAHQLEYRMLAADGRPVWLKDIVTVIAGGGQPVKLLGLMVDITERKREQTALRESEQRLRSIFDMMFVFVGLMNPDGVIVEVNNAPLEAARLKREDVLGRTVAESYWFAHSPAQQARVRQALARAAQGEITREDYSIRVADGRFITIDTTLAPLRDASGRVTQIVGSAVDITERKHAEKRVGHLNRVYSVLSDINQAIVREKDPRAMLASACRIAVEKGKFRMAWIGLLDTATHKVKPVASAGAVDGYLDQADIDLQDTTRNTGPTARALLSGAHVICNDLASDPPFGPWRDEALRRGYRSSAAFPLKVHGNPAGTFNLYWHEPGFFDEEEFRLLDELAADISFALEVGELEVARRAAEDRHTRQRSALITLASQRGPNSDEVIRALGQLAEAAARTLNVARVSVWR